MRNNRPTNTVSMNHNVRSALRSPALITHHSSLITSSLCLILIASFATGCAGYAWVDASNPGGKLWRSDVRSVAVPTFSNPTFRREDELRLTRAIAQEIETRTPYKIAPADAADTVLEGRIVSADVATVIRERNTGVPQEQLYVMRVDFVWKDLRTGEVLVERQNFEATAAYFPYLGESTFAGSESTAQALAEAVVDELQADW